MKKLKLSLSICMMCLCVAVLCMGILAASSATYSITGKISYNMIDGVALVNTRVYKVAGTTSASDLSTACTNLSSKSFEEIERDTSTYYILSQKLDSQPLINTSNETSSSKTTSVNIVYGAVDSGVEYYTYYVVIEIKNVSTDTGYVLNSYLDTLATSEISEIVSNANGSTNIVTIKSGEFSNIVIGFSYKGDDKTKIDEFKWTLNVEYVESSPEISLNISTNLIKGGGNEKFSMTVTQYTEEIDYLSNEKTNATLKPASNFRARAKKIESGDLSLSGGTLIGTYSSAGSFDIEAQFNADVSVVWIVCSITNTGYAEFAKIIEDKELDFYTTNCFLYRSMDIVSLSTNSSANIVFGYALNGLNSNVSSVDLSYDISIMSRGYYDDLKQQKEYTKNGETIASYYYYEKGDFYGLPIRWRVIAGCTSSDSGVTVGTYEGDSTYYSYKYAKSDYLGSCGNCAYGICIQETNTSAYYTERADGQMLGYCSFNNYSGDYKYDESGVICNGIYANDYSNSKIYSYLGGSDVGKYSSGSSNNSNGNTSNFLTDINIDVDATSNAISVCYRVSMTRRENNNIFWLLSSEELLTWLAGVTSWSDDVNASLKWRYYEGDSVKSTPYWLTSVPSSDYSSAYYVGSNGECCKGTVNSFNISVRPACVVRYYSGGSKWFWHGVMNNNWKNLVWCDDW